VPSEELSLYMSPVENHRKREMGILVYPVYSRRSAGLSIGINMFPGEKYCSFDCPYCEVFPFSSSAVFSLKQMEDELRSAVNEALEMKIRVMDICFSGNGESTLSPDFPAALKLASCVRAQMVPSAKLVLITNSSGLLYEKIFAVLREAASSNELDIWLKLDAGTQQWYERINCSNIPHEKIIAKLKEFLSCAPATIQTMMCTVDGSGPPAEEAKAWEKLITELAVASAPAVAGRKTGIRELQIYGKARPAPGDPKTGALPLDALEERAASLRLALADALTGALGVDGGSVVPRVVVYP
jgi:histidinol dehydrogenase